MVEPRSKFSQKENICVWIRRFQVNRAMQWDWNIGIIWSTETININWIISTNQSQSEQNRIQFNVCLNYKKHNATFAVGWRSVDSHSIWFISCFYLFPLLVFHYFPLRISRRIRLWYMGWDWCWPIFMAQFWNWSEGAVAKIPSRSWALLKNPELGQFDQEFIAFLWARTFIAIFTRTRS